jgi:hypothetical protein
MVAPSMVPLVVETETCMVVTVVVLAGIKWASTETSQSPAVRERLARLVAVLLAIEKAEPLSTFDSWYSPTYPLAALSLVVVPLTGPGKALVSIHAPLPELAAEL